MDKKGTVLIVEDEEIYCDYYKEMLLKQKYNIEIAASLKIAGEKLRRLKPDVVLLDLRFPPRYEPEEGLAFLEEIRNEEPSIKVIIVTGVKDRNIALQAILRGAYDFVVKARDSYTELPFRVNQAFERLQLERELVGFKQKQVSQLGGYFYGPGQMIVGTSEKMAALYRKIDRIAPTNATVLITGETGTGKELVARAIHYNSPRRLKPFIPVLIVATPKEQIEAELFGIGRRIATQVDARPGKFREAEYGTLFLDEIGEVSLDIQPKLLRAIERKEIQGVGMPTTTVDVRIIASTNKALEQAAEKGEFREDLWFRISVVKLVVPPLRERKSDIPMLAEHFLRTKAAQHGKSIIGFQEGTIDFLTGYSWPGNVRELENSIEQVVVFDEDGWISVDDIKNQMQINSPVERAVALPRLKASLSLFDHVENYERTLIIDALKKSNWIKTQAAGQLRVPESTLRSKMKQLGISEDEPVEK